MGGSTGARGELYNASQRSYDGLPELSYQFYDRDVLVTSCGRLCLHRKRINISTVLAGQKLGIKEVDEGIWLVSFMNCDLGYFDLEQKTCDPSTTPSARGRHPSLGTRGYLCLRAGQKNIGAGEGNRTLVFSLEGCCSTIELHPR